MNSIISKIVFGIGRIGTLGIEILGTCFYIGNGKFATAAHVVGNNDTNLRILITNIQSLNEYQDTTDNSVQHVEARISAINPLRDVCVLESDVFISANFTLGDLDDSIVGEKVYIYGYPHSNHGRFVLTQQQAHIGAKVLNGSSGLKNKGIVLNIQSQPGQSGSPIFNSDQGLIVGMLIGSYAPNGATGQISIGGIDPQALHQTTHAVSAEYIKELINEGH